MTDAIKFCEDELTKRKQARWRGKYGERRLAKKVGGVVVGRSKAVKIRDGRGRCDCGQWGGERMEGFRCDKCGVEVKNARFIQINCQKPPDVVTEIFSFESKWLKEAPKFLQKIMTQAGDNCPAGLTPVGVVGDRDGRVVYYIMLEKDFLDLHI